MVKVGTKTRIISLLVSLTLLSSFFATSPARADELSDAKASLSTAATKLASLQTSLNIANSDITAFNIKLNATDTSTADGPAIYASFQTQLDTARAVKATIESQIPAAQSDVNTWTAKVATLTAAINAGNNCPADWGLTASNFSEGIDVGNFYFNTKVMNEINKDPRNIVVSTNFQISRDGINWTNYQIFSSQYWINSSNNYKYSSTPQYAGVIRDSYSLLKFSNARVKTVTTLDKQNCATYSLESEVKVLTTAAIPFSKTSIDELYAAYPQAFPNYQVRDQAIAAIATIKSDLATLAGSGSQFSFGKGYMGNFQLATYPRSGSCNGDINTANVGYNSTCELGIYWLYGNTIKFVDSISVVGGQSEASKQQAAMKIQLVALVAAAQKIYDSFINTSNDYSNFKNKIGDNFAAAGQAGIDQALSFSSTFATLFVSAQDTLNQLDLLSRSQYMNAELQSLVSQPRGQITKIWQSLRSNPDDAKSLAAEISNALNAPSADQIKESARVKAYDIMATADLLAANSLMQNIIDKWNKGYYKNITKEALTKEIYEVNSLRSTFSERLNTTNQIYAQLNSSIVNAKTSAEISNWKNIQATYANITRNYSNALASLEKATSYHKMVQPIGSAEVQNELAKSNAVLLFSNIEIQNLKTGLADYENMVVAKRIASNSSAYEAEVNRLQKLLSGYSQNMSEISAGLSLASKYLSTGTDSQSWQQIQTSYTSAMNNLASSTSIAKSMLVILTKQKKSANGAEIESDPDATGPNFVDDNGEDEVAAGTIVSKKDKQGRYLITVTSNQADTDITIKAIKSKSKAIVFNGTTDADGNYYLRTTRKLVGYTLQLVLDSEILAKTSKLK